MNPVQVLYSDLVQMVEAGKVRSARLEVGSCQLYFDVVADTPAASAAQPTTEAASAAAVGATAAAEAAARLATTVPPVPTVRSRAGVARPFFCKVADKNDAMLVGQLLKAGVDYGVVRAGAWSQIGQAFLAAFSLWLPLLPLFFIARKVLESRMGTG